MFLTSALASLTTAAAAPSAVAAAGATNSFTYAASMVSSVAPAASSGIFTLSNLGTALTVFGGLSALAAGNAQAQAYKQQAMVEEVNAKSAVISGLREQNDLTDELLDTMARQRAALAGSGVDLSAGTRNQIFGETNRRANYARSSSQLDAAVTARSHQLSARGLMASANEARLSSYGMAAGIFGNWAMRRSARG